MSEGAKIQINPQIKCLLSSAQLTVFSKLQNHRRGLLCNCLCLHLHIFQEDPFDLWSDEARHFLHRLRAPLVLPLQAVIPLDHVGFVNRSGLWPAVTLTWLTPALPHILSRETSHTNALFPAMVYKDGLTKHYGRSGEDSSCWHRTPAWSLRASALSLDDFTTQVSVMLNLFPRSCK